MEPQAAEGSAEGEPAFLLPGQPAFTVDQYGTFRADLRLAQPFHVELPLSVTFPFHALVSSFGEDGGAQVDIKRFHGVPEDATTWMTAVGSARDEKVATSQGIFVETLKGRKLVTCEEYARMAQSVRADVFVTMADQARDGASAKRISRALERTCTWLEKQVALWREDPRGALYVGVPGCCFQRGAVSSKLLDAIASNRQSISGFVLLGGSLPKEPILRRDAMGAILQATRMAMTTDQPTNGMRVRAAVTGLRTPLDMLNAVELGASLVSWPLPESFAVAGKALVFDNSFEADRRQSGGKRKRTETVYELLDLSDPRYERDDRPILASCACEACQRHTRAYIHHLLRAKEMLATQLLRIHNFHHAYKFCEALQKAKGAGAVEAFGERVRASCDETAYEPAAAPSAEKRAKISATT